MTPFLRSRIRNAASPRLRAVAPRAVLALLALALPLAAQQRDTTLHLSSVARSAVETYNAPATMRVNGALDVEPRRDIGGDVAVLNGPVTISGRIRGSLVAINADVRLAPGARVDQHVIVVGGVIGGRDSAQIGGEIRRQEELLRYHLEGERLVAEREPEYDDSWWQRHHVRHEFRRGEAYTEFFYVASRAYNRVEGWSFVVGPRFQRSAAWGNVNVDALGVVRTANPVRWDENTLGHDATGEIQFGKPIGVALGAHAFDVVEPTESWQLGSGEVGLASVALHRDFRDYFARHGGEAFVRFVNGHDLDVTLSFSDEQWRDRRDRDPWSLFRNGERWRANPPMDEGNVHLVTTRLHVDTREREGTSWSGWYLLAEVEQGAGRITRLGAPVLTFAPSVENIWYSRGFVDLRRYNRISPDAYLNLRVAGGGWLHGDALPTQRRLALGGPGTLPGYAFRETGLSPDALQCSTIPQGGTPGQCERVALAQVELRSRFLSSVFRDDRDDNWWRPGLNHRAAWVLFADAGRGWSVITPQSSGTTSGRQLFAAGALPPLSSFKVDLGAGIDFGGLGVYWAKAVSDGDEPVRFFVRLERRF